jgi:SAM-dependent methyltransferase
MSLVEEYQRQFRWRPWNLIFEEVPLERGQTIFDLGCGIGDQARALASRGCRVIGLDGNQELIDAARVDNGPDCQFLTCDLRNPPEVGVVADGIWCSFTAAYLTNLTDFLTTWSPFLRSGGWIAITEIENLFGHEPLRPRTRLLLEDFSNDARAAGRYDFHMGGKLEGHLAEAGFAVTRVLTLPDQELAFQGPAMPDVLEAWRRRFERLPGLRSLCASEFASVQEDFLSCLSRPDHVSTAKVITCIGRKVS